MKAATTSEMYTEYSVTLSELNDMELGINNKRRLLQHLDRQIRSIKENSGCCLEFTDHAFRQLSERLEALAKLEIVINDDVYNKEDYDKSLIIPSNLKSFLTNLLSSAMKSNSYKVSTNPKSKDPEYRYSIEIKKWSSTKKLIFTAVVENFKIKTCFFNWV